jgi:hypothetical protein
MCNILENKCTSARNLHRKLSGAHLFVTHNGLKVSYSKLNCVPPTGQCVRRYRSLPRCAPNKKYAISNIICKFSSIKTFTTHFNVHLTEGLSDFWATVYYLDLPIYLHFFVKNQSNINKIKQDRY